jgi:hypothetical protein
MKCDDYKKMIYLYGELDEGELQKVQSHIATCKTCSELYEQVQKERQILKTITSSYKTKDVDPVLTNRIMSAVSKSKIHRISLADQFFELFQYQLLRYTLGAVSLFLIVLFAVEFNDKPDNHWQTLHENTPAQTRTVELKSSAMNTQLHQLLQSEKIFRPKKNLSLYACLYACKINTEINCSDCKTKYLK